MNRISDDNKLRVVGFKNVMFPIFLKSFDLNVAWEKEGRPYIGPWRIGDDEYYIPITSSVENKTEGIGFSEIDEKDGLWICKAVPIPSNEVETYNLNKRTAKILAYANDNFDIIQQRLEKIVSSPKIKNDPSMRYRVNQKKISEAFVEYNKYGVNPERLVQRLDELLEKALINKIESRGIIGGLKKGINELREKVKELDTKNQALEKRNNKELKIEIKKGVRDSSNNLIKDKQNLEKSLSESHQLNSELNSENNSLKKINKTLSKKVTKQSEKIQSLFNSNKSLKNTNNALAAKNKALTEERDSKVKQITCLEDRLAALLTKVDTLVNEINTLREKTNAPENGVMDHEENEDLKIKNVELTQDNARLIKENEKLLKTVIDYLEVDIEQIKNKQHELGPIFSRIENEYGDTLKNASLIEKKNLLKEIKSKFEQVIETQKQEQNTTGEVVNANKGIWGYIKGIFNSKEKVETINNKISAATTESITDITPIIEKVNEEGETIKTSDIDNYDKKNEKIDGQPSMILHNLKTFSAIAALSIEYPKKFWNIIYGNPNENSTKKGTSNRALGRRIMLNGQKRVMSQHEMKRRELSESIHNK